MKRIALVIAVAAALVCVLAGTGFCQEDEEMDRKERRPPLAGGERGERPEGRKRLWGMRNREGGGEEGEQGRMQGRDRMGGKRDERMGRFGGRGGEGKKIDPEMLERMKEIHEVEKQSRKLAEQYRDAETDEEKQGIAEDLKSVLVKSFDLKILNQQKNMERLAKRLEELKELLAKRKESRNDVIQKRFEELTGKTEHLKW